MTDRADLFRSFLDLHRPGSPLVMPNPWDAGTARLFASLGFRALATTSSGFAATLGRMDGAVTRDEALEHSRIVAGATDLPVNADLEACFADSPEGVAETLSLARRTGIAGCSVEDWSGSALYEARAATARVAAAAEVAHAGGDGNRLVLTARAENHLRGNPDLDDTIARLRAYEEAGADVLYAPGLSRLADIERVVEAVKRPLNVLILPGGPTVSELAAAGVARISVGGAFNLVGLGAVTAAARALLEDGTHEFWGVAKAGWQARDRAFSD